MSDHDEKSQVEIGQATTPGEWRVKISMEINQISRDLKDLKEAMKDVTTMEQKIYARIHTDYSSRLDVLEVAQGNNTERLANLTGQFKVVAGILSLALAALFTWMVSKSSTPVVIKMDGQAVKSTSKQLP